MLDPSEGFIDVRFVLDRIPDEETYITRVERMGYLLPDGTTSDEIQNIIMNFWEYPREIASDLSEAFRDLPAPNTKETTK